MAFFQAPLPHQTSALAHAPMLCFDRMIAPARAANQPSGIRYAFETTCSLKAAQAKDHDSIFTSEPDRKSGKTSCKKSHRIQNGGGDQSPLRRSTVVEFSQ
jgi:hypothetical protein